MFQNSSRYVSLCSRSFPFTCRHNRKEAKGGKNTSAQSNRHGIVTHGQQRTRHPALPALRSSSTHLHGLCRATCRSIRPRTSLAGSLRCDGVGIKGAVRVVLSRLRVCVMYVPARHAQIANAPGRCYSVLHPRNCVSLTTLGAEDSRPAPWNNGGEALEVIDAGYE